LPKFKTASNSRIQKIEKKNELIDANIIYPQIQGLTDKEYEEN